MSKSSSKHKSLSSFQQEFDSFVLELKRLFNTISNCFFALTIEGKKRRLTLLIGGFLLVGFLFGFLTRDFSEWTRLIKNIFSYLFYLETTENFTINPIQEFLQTIQIIYFNATGIRYFFLFALPFFVAWQLAAIYLADIFELDKITTASKFIMHASLLGENSRLHIREGEVAMEDEDSPAYRIGGPGIVTVELDSVALFEQPDGRPYVVGPTVKQSFILDGFERFRQAFNLRNLRTDRIEISSRSLDGIPVQSIGVSYLFSVDRGENSVPTAERPYPFRTARTIESLVYGTVARVTPNGPRPADISRSWFGSMTALISSTLARFMSEHKLTEYLASYGMPEIRSARDQADAVVQAAQRVLPPDRHIPPPPVDITPPLFVSRPDIKANLFNDFAAEFPFLASQRGVELHWVGIGLWKTPSEIIPNQHLEAWQLSMDNQVRRNKRPLPLRELYFSQFIQDIPLGRFEESRKKQQTHHETMINLLIGYREQFMKILYIMEKEHERFNNGNINTILAALRHINRILGYPEDFNAHWIR